MKNYKTELEKVLNDSEIFENESMSAHTTFKCGGRAACFVLANSLQDIKSIVSFARARNIQYLVIGNGSNILFSDGGFDGIVIKLGSEFDNIILTDDVISCEASALLSTVSKFAETRSLSGLEFACGIPASIGGAIYMNAGAYEGSVADVLLSVTSMKKDGEIVERTRAELLMEYRNTSFMTNGEVVLAAKFKLKPSDRKSIQDKMAEYTKLRTSKQPLNYPSAGSFFKRPAGYFAGKLIEDAGLKGYAVGGAMVSTLHAGFIINANDASATDVINLMHDVQRIVKEKFDVELQPEVQIVGD